MAVIYIFRDEADTKPVHARQHHIGVNIAEYIRDRFGYGYTNVSHSGNYVLVIGGDVLVGVDVEMLGRSVSDALVRRSLSEAEQKRSSGADDFLRYWTLKEAYGKCMGVGLIYDYKNTDFVLPEVAAHTVQRVCGADAEYSYVNCVCGDIVFSACAKNVNESFSLEHIKMTDDGADYVVAPWDE